MHHACVKVQKMKQLKRIFALLAVAALCVFTGAVSTFAGEEASQAEGIVTGLVTEEGFDVGIFLACIIILVVIVAVIVVASVFSSFTSGIFFDE